MTLKEEIQQRLVDYYRQGKKRIAYEISLLYLRFAKKEVPKDKAIAACIEGLYWLKIAGCSTDADLIEPNLKVLKDMLERSVDIYMREKN